MARDEGGRMILELTIPGEFMTLNDHENAARTHWAKGAKSKKADTERVQYDESVMAAQPVTVYPVRVVFTWCRVDARSDLDNIAFAKKSILDGLVRAKVLKGDGYKFIQEIQDFYVIDKLAPGVDIRIEPI